MAVWLGVDFMSAGGFNTYKIAAAGVGVLLLCMAGFGWGSSVGARVISGLTGLGFVAYAVYLQFLLEPGVVAVYPALFILAFLVIGYALYTRAVNREDAAAQAKADRDTAAQSTTDSDT